MKKGQKATKFFKYQNRAKRPERIIRSVYFEKQHLRTFQKIAKKTNISVNALAQIAFVDLLAKSTDLKVIKEMIKKNNRMTYQSFGEYKRSVK